jgi:sugar transferase (PEP-CTERM/EpsH1 system associated)
LKIAFLTARFPYPLDRGDRLTSYELIRELSRRHAVTLFSLIDGSEPREGYAELSRLTSAIHVVRLSRWRSWLQAWLGLLSRVPSQVAYYRSSAMRRLVEREVDISRFDVVFVQLFRMAPYVREVRHPAKILFMADSIGLNLRRAEQFCPWWRRPGVRWEAWRAARFEVRSAREFREAWVVSPRDRDDLRGRGCPNVVVAAHGVNQRLFDVRRAPAGTGRLMFLGNLSVPHNVDAACHAARDIFPYIRERKPGAELLLVGASPSLAVRRLSALPGVRVTGAVPDLGEFWSTSDALIAPLRFSSGIQNKVLEAMAAGLPVLTTPQVAEALDALNGGLLRAESDPKGLAMAALELLDHPAAAAAMAERARDFARLNYSWSRLGEQLERVAPESR